MTTTTRTARQAAFSAAWTLFFAGAAGLGIGSAASAQTLRVQKPFSVTLGGHIPNDLNEGFFYMGLSYAVAKSNVANPAAGYVLYKVYVDYATLFLSGGQGAQGGTDTSSRQRSVGVGPVAAFYLGAANASVRPFVGAGVGYYNVQVYKPAAVSRFGGKIFTGLEFKGGFLSEVDYTHVGAAGSANAEGLGVRLGYRF